MTCRALLLALQSAGRAPMQADPDSTLAGSGTFTTHFFGRDSHFRKVQPQACLQCSLLCYT
jgi:hypothetical protein